MPGIQLSFGIQLSLPASWVRREQVRALCERANVHTVNTMMRVTSRSHPQLDHPSLLAVASSQPIERSVRRKVLSCAVISLPEVLEMGDCKPFSRWSESGSRSVPVCRAAALYRHSSAEASRPLSGPLRADLTDLGMCIRC